MVKKKEKNKFQLYWAFFLLGLGFFLIYYTFIGGTSEYLSSHFDYSTAEENEEGIKISEDGTKYLVNPKDILSGGPPKGGIGVERGIPALAKENIKFETVTQADSWIKDNELVLVLEYNGVKRVYPFQILVWHEIVNDKINNVPLLITYCPLCGSGIVYERKILINTSNVETRFGTTGKLYNSNVIMYDEETNTYWQQIGGRAIIGELTGQKLQLIDSNTVTWGKFKIQNPDAMVLSQDTGFNRKYGNDPYGSYYENSHLLFPVNEIDSRIHPKDVIYGIEISGNYKAYREIDIIKNKKIEDTFLGMEIIITVLEDGRVQFFNQNSSQIIPKERDFWFAWYAFHPNTELYEVRL
jgi:hypothetical protein